MNFPIPVKTSIRSQNGRRTTIHQAFLRIEQNGGGVNGPILVVKTTNIHLKSCTWPNNGCSIQDNKGELYLFSLKTTYDTQDNRLLLMQFLEAAKQITKGKKLKTRQMISHTTYGQTWIHLHKHLDVPTAEMYLTRLNLTDRNLKQLPTAVGKLHLTELILDDNEMSAEYWSWLHPPILNTLTTLSLKNNQMVEFPWQVLHFKELRNLNLDKNSFRFIPNRLFLRRPYLQYLNVSNNPNLEALPSFTNFMDTLCVNHCPKLTQTNHESISTDLNIVPTLMDLSAEVVINSEKLFSEIISLPYALQKKLLKAPVCVKCIKFQTKIIRSEFRRGYLHSFRKIEGVLCAFLPTVSYYCYKHPT